MSAILIMLLENDENLVVPKLKSKYGKNLEAFLEEFLSKDVINLEKILSEMDDCNPEDPDFKESMLLIMPIFLSFSQYSLFIEHDYDKALEYTEIVIYAYENNFIKNTAGVSILITQAYNTRVYILIEMGRCEEAFPLLEKALKVSEDKFGSNNIITNFTYFNFVCYFQKFGDFQQAIFWCDKVLENREFFGEENILIKVTADIKKESELLLRERQTEF
jgi:tetratricopeptide (TPR) repeat protein